MKTMKDLKNHSRVVAAIAAKDMADALRNKTVLTIIAGMVMLVLSSRALPMLLSLDGKARVTIYEAGETGLVQALRNDDQLALVRARSPEELETTLGEGTEMGLGLIIPADFGQAGGSFEVKGFAMHWTKTATISEQKDLLEDKLGDIAGRPIHIQVEGHTLYPEPDVNGQPFMVALVMVVAILVVSLLVVPLLITEEKEARTLDALFVSPATAGQVLAGKALAGMVYGLTAAAVILLFNLALIHLWWVALLAVFAGATFAMALGLLLGGLFDNQQNLTLWSGLILILLLAPLFVVNVATAGMPEIVQKIAPWTPAVALIDLLRASFSNGVGSNLVLPDLAVLIAGASILLFLASRQMRGLEG